MKKAKPILLMVSILLVTFNLRPAITSAGPLLDDIRRALSLPGFAAGLLTALPLLAFAMFSPLAPLVARRYGNEKTVLAGILLIIAGIAIRSIGTTVPLFAGTLLLGIGISAGNVLITAIIKNRLPQHVGLMTSMYSTGLSITAGIASGVSVPLADGLGWGWKTSLFVWIFPAAAAALLWLPQIRYRSTATISAAASPVLPHSTNIWRSALAWQIALFMGLQSLLFYSLVAWLPGILQNHGMDASTSGWLLAYYQFISLPIAFIIPIIAIRFKDQRAFAFLSGITYTIGLIGLLIGGSVPLLTIWITLMGVGGGASISLALMFFNLRSSSGQQAAQLSGMSQSIGYLLAASGPVLLGTIGDHFSSSVPSILILIVSSVLLTLFGLFAGRNRTIDEQAGVKKDISI